MEIHSFFVSPESKYYSGKKSGQGINPNAPELTPEVVECHAGKGIVGDRFYNYQPDFKGQVTFISYDLHLELSQFLKQEFSLNHYRRNIFVKNGDPLKEFLGHQFQIGEAVFEGIENCTPCKFMDQSIGQGAWDWMNQNQAGGLRAKVVKSGVLRIGDLLLKV